MVFEQVCIFLRSRTEFMREKKACFYRPTYLGLKRVEEGHDIPTAAVDGGKRLFVNVPWMRKHTIAQIMGVIVHECLHIILRHHVRWPGIFAKAKEIFGKLQEGPTFTVWNIACDMRINPDLIEDGWSLPPSGIFDPEKKYKGWSAERIFLDMMKKEKERQDAGGGPDDPDAPKMPGWGSFSPFTGSGSNGKPTEEEVREEEQKIGRQVVAGMAMAKSQGSVPGSAKELIQETIRKPDWKDLLPAEIQKVIGADEYTTSRMSRSGRRSGFVLPGTVAFRLGKVGMGFDTSGSISAKELTLYGGQANGLIQSEEPEEIILLQCDARVQNVQRLEQGETIGAITVHGRGGTRFEPVFEWFEEHEPDIELMVYMTDGHGSFPKEAPPYHTIWLITTDVVAPFGTTIRIHP